MRPVGPQRGPEIRVSVVAPQRDIFERVIGDVELLEHVAADDLEGLGDLVAGRELPASERGAASRASISR